MSDIPVRTQRDIAVQALNDIMALPRPAVGFGLKARVGTALRDIARIERAAPQPAGHWLFVPDAPEEPE